MRSSLSPARAANSTAWISNSPRHNAVDHDLSVITDCADYQSITLLGYFEAFAALRWGGRACVKSFLALAVCEITNAPRSVNTAAEPLVHEIERSI